MPPLFKVRPLAAGTYYVLVESTSNLDGNGSVVDPAKFEDFYIDHLRISGSRELKITRQPVASDTAPCSSANPVMPSIVTFVPSSV